MSSQPARKYRNDKRFKRLRMLSEWDRRQPGRTETIFRALTNVVPSHLCDTDLFDFVGLDTDRAPAAADWLMPGRSATGSWAGSHGHRR